MDNKKQIVILGGGITGLSAAWYLKNHLNDATEVTLIDAGETLGGKISTRQVELESGERLVMDGGPEYFVSRQPETWLLAEELGLSDAVRDAGRKYERLFILSGGEAVRVARSPLGWVSSGLLSGRAKLRMLKEPFIPAKKGELDESVAAFVTRRLGREAFEKVVGPILAGYYNTDLDRESVYAAFPRLIGMEAEFGGLVDGEIRQRIGRNKTSEIGASRRPELFTFAQGTQTLVDQLAARLDFDIRTGTRALEVNKSGKGFQVVLSSGMPLSADAVILATPAPVGSELLKYIAPESATLLFQIRHEPIGTVFLAYRKGEVENQEQRYDLLIPRREGRRIDAVSWQSGREWKQIPAGLEVLKIYLGGADPGLVRLAEAEIVSEVRRELKEILGISAAPEHVEVFRWLKGNPMLDVGHLELLDLIESQLPKGLFLAGSSYRGKNAADCIRQGYDAAEFSLQHLEGR